MKRALRVSQEGTRHSREGSGAAGDGSPFQVPFLREGLFLLVPGGEATGLR